MIFIVTREASEYGYICQSQDRQTFMACLDEPDNAVQARFIQRSAVGDTVYLLERVFNREYEWTARPIDLDVELDTAGVLYLISLDGVENEKV